ncbi:hypothetical protein Gorai_006066, partial [Gossypium raimondii]|nr:hypothetical protein [Gossypium raimondii]
GAKTLKKKKKSLCVTWSDEDSSSEFDLEEDYHNFIAFAPSTVKGDYKDSDGCSNFGSDEEFVKTYKELLNK